MKNLKRLFTITLLVFFTLSGQATADRPTHEIHSMMIYNFVKYVQWPGYNSSQEFVIGVIGDDNVYNTLMGWYNGKIKGDKKFSVKKFNSAEEVSNCHIIYVGKKQSKSFDTINEKIAGQSTLSITNGNGLGAKGSAINFKVVNNKLAFELNQNAVEKARLKVSSQLAAMAILI